MYVNDGANAAILRTNRLEIDTISGPPPLQNPFGTNLVDRVFTNTPGPFDVLGIPDTWFEVIVAGTAYSVPGYII